MSPKFGCHQYLQNGCFRQNLVLYIYETILREHRDIDMVATEWKMFLWSDCQKLSENIFWSTYVCCIFRFSREIFIKMTMLMHQRFLDWYSLSQTFETFNYLRCRNFIMQILVIYQPSTHNRSIVFTLWSLNFIEKEVYPFFCPIMG